MRMLSLAAVTLVVAVGSTSSAPAIAAYGYCIEPKAPSAMFLTRPSKPYCVSGCSEWEVSSYKREVSAYYDSLQQYANDVDRYYKKAGEYIQCMADLD